MTKEDIQKCLTHPKNGENNRKLLAFCSEPRTFGEMGKSGVKGDVFNVVVELKKAGALEFADGKYVSTQLAMEVLKSLQ